MKTGWVIAIVIAVHCVAIGSLIMIQGCGTARGPVVSPAKPENVRLPSPVEETAPVVPTPVAPTPAAPMAIGETPDAKSLTAKTTTYTVAAGDSLSSVAHKFHLSVAEIQSLNNIKDPKKIHVGQKLLLPGELDLNAAVPAATAKKAAAKSKVTAPSAPSVAAPASQSPQEGTDKYVVKSGDSLSHIASHFKTTVDSICTANGITAKSKLVIGQKLIIPAGAPDKKSGPKTDAATKSAHNAKLPLPVVASTPSPAPVLSTVPAVVQKPTPVPAPKPAAPSGPPNVDLSTAPVSTLSPVPEVTTATSSPTTTGGKPVSIIPYTVLKGDNLDTIKQKYAVSEETIRKYNKLPADATLTPGQVLSIPISE